MQYLPHYRSFGILFVGKSSLPQLCTVIWQARFVTQGMRGGEIRFFVDLNKSISSRGSGGHSNGLLKIKSYL